MSLCSIIYENDEKRCHLKEKWSCLRVRKMRTPTITRKKNQRYVFNDVDNIPLSTQTLWSIHIKLNAFTVFGYKEQKTQKLFLDIYQMKDITCFVVRLRQFHIQKCSLWFYIVISRLKQRQNMYVLFTLCCILILF